MVYRVFVEKKQKFSEEAKALYNDFIKLLQIKNLENLRVVNRYDVENIDLETYEKAKNTIFSEPQVDNVMKTLDIKGARYVFAVEYLPGQFDQRADSASQCIQLMSQGDKPLVKTAKVYVLYGDKLTDKQINKIKKYLINPVEAREANMEKVDTLITNYNMPDSIAVLNGFCKLDKKGLADFVTNYGLAMDNDDIKTCQDYFVSEKRDPTITEIKMLDTYWSDHCRHTTFLTTIDDVKFESELLQDTFNEYLKARKEINRTKPINLMDLGTIVAKLLKKQGKMPMLDESEEINACTVKMNIKVDGKDEKWLLLFKNETHNHPTEIEPFGGAATCIGGAIRDPLSGRAYVYSAMRITGAGNPLLEVEKTMKGKLPQRKIVTTAANGYSSYGNQIGLATGQVDEIYHSGYVAKRMEIGAVVGATPEKNVIRIRPIDGDIVILLGGKTGRDGCGGATGSSKSHSIESLDTCGAEVQKGNAPEERKLQRLFRNEEASLLIKRCNDFGAGGVSVAIGELADGIVIDLDKVPKKYNGLDGTELAISESQERMAVVVAKENVDKFINIANKENLEATVVAKVSDNPRLIMNWKGKTIVDISREFLDTNGAEKHINVVAKKPLDFKKKTPTNFEDEYKNLAGDLNICSKQGLSERFDSTIGAGTILMPFGGKYQLTPIQAMANKVSTEKGDSDTCSVMSYGYNPFISEKSPYHGAYLAVIESVSKLIATGASFEEVYLTFQEYFAKPNKKPERFGQPLSALLGAFKAQKELGIAAIGGKDSMSGTFENIDVPPTLVSFAVTPEKIKNIISNEFKNQGNNVYLLLPDYDDNNLPNTKSYLDLIEKVTKYIRSGKVKSCYTPTLGGVAEAIMKMSFGNKLGFEYDDNLDIKTIFDYNYGAFIIETDEEIKDALLLGKVSKGQIKYKKTIIKLEDLLNIYQSKLEPVYPTKTNNKKTKIENISFQTSKFGKSNLSVAKPKVLIPVFPGTNCEYDSAKQIELANAKADIFVINNLSTAGIVESVNEFAKRIKNSQMIFIPGGFSGGDEPDGSGKFITAFLRNQKIMESINDLLKNRDGLMCGICNGFQALIKLGLVPYGEITDITSDSPTLTYNTISRHQSRIVRTRIASNKSPWLANCDVGNIVNVPISHGEGRFVANDKWLQKLIENGQVATQYVDYNGNATSDVEYNPNNSVMAIEGITSPDGRILGKMGHSERIGSGLYKNVSGNYDIELFKSAVKYYK